MKMGFTREVRRLLDLNEWPSLEEWLRILWESANTFIDDVVRLFEWLAERIR